MCVPITNIGVVLPPPHTHASHTAIPINCPLELVASYFIYMYIYVYIWLTCAHCFNDAIIFNSYELAGWRDTSKVLEPTSHDIAKVEFDKTYEWRDPGAKAKHDAENAMWISM